MSKERLAVGEIPEVVEYVNAQDTIEEFEAAHKKTFEKYRELIEIRNTLLEAAEKIVRGKKVSCGPFNLKQIRVAYNAEDLYQAIGRDMFLSIGGTVETINSYNVDEKKLQAAVASKKISNAVLEEVRKDTPVYNAPKKALLP